MCVQPNPDRFVQQSSRFLRDHLGANRAQRGQLGFAIPVMIEDRSEEGHRGETGADLRALVGVAHRDVRALRDQDVERCGADRRESL